MNVQLGYTHIPHADDTEDIIDDDEKSYDHHHSKEWNALVDQKSQELENEMKIEENTKIAAKKAAEEAKRKAIEEKAKQEAEKRKKAQELAQQKTKKVKVQTVDFNDIYSGITPDEITLQTDAKINYELHSRMWNEMVDQQTAELEKTLKESDEADLKNQKVYGTTDALTEEKFKSQQEREAEEQSHHHKTIDMGELYDGMALQTGYRDSPYWANRVSTAQEQLEQLMRQQDEPKYNQENPSVDLNELYNGMAIQTVQDMGHSPYWDNRVSTAQRQLEDLMRKSEEKEYSHENPSVDINELWNGMAVQIGDAHDIHSKNWYANQESIEKKWNQQQAVAEYEGRDLEAEEIPVVHRQTIDQSELYNGMAVQLGDAHDIHSKNWYANQAALENKWNQEQAVAEYEGKDLNA